MMMSVGFVAASGKFVTSAALPAAASLPAGAFVAPPKPPER